MLSLEINLDDIKNSDGTPNYSYLEGVSIEFPSESVRKGITKDVIGRITTRNDREDAGAIGVNGSGEDVWEYGGRGLEPDYSKEVVQAHSGEQVKKALEQLHGKGATPVWWVHSHPHEGAPFGRRGDWEQKPSSQDKYSAALLRLPGILITHKFTFFFGSNGTFAKIRTDDFKVETP